MWHGWDDPSLDEESTMIYVDPDTDAGTVVRITRAPKEPSLSGMISTTTSPKAG